jgi:hypothetical protein
MPEREITVSNLRRRIVFGLVVAAIFAGWACGHALWWRSFPYPYEPQLAYEAAKFNQHLRYDGFAEFIAHLKLSQYYPPLYEILLGSVHALLGFALGNAVLLNIILLLIAALAVYSATRPLRGRVRRTGRGCALSGIRSPFRPDPPAQPRDRRDGRGGRVSGRPARPSLAAQSRGGGRFRGPVQRRPDVQVDLRDLRDRSDDRVFGGQLLEKKGKRIYLAVSVGLIAAVGFILCAPWYLGVLDLKYLAASSGNDPTGGLLSDRLRFYPQALGLRYLGGEAAAYLLLGLAFLTVFEAATPRVGSGGDAVCLLGVAVVDSP